MTPDSVSRLNAALEGRYRVERQLGEGGMATVYLARDEKHNRNVALKVLKPERAAAVGADRFLAEIQTTANLQHPFILPLFDSGEANGFLFYVMPHMEGESLRQRLDRERQLPVDEAVQIAESVAEALDFAHSRGVVHRDIKPGNILFQQGEPAVSDFGIALALSHDGGGRLTEAGLSPGTPYYMSPEQAAGDSGVGPATDIYALGCVLYEMLVGEPPYTGRTPQAVLGKAMASEAPSASKVRKSVPPNVDAAIRKAIEKVPADRFGNAKGFVRALGDAGFRYDHPTPASSKGSAWSRSAAAAGFAVALVAIGLPALWPGASGPEPRAATVFPAVLPGGGEIVAAQGWAVSPDGRTVIVEHAESGLLYRRDLGSLPAVPIPNTEGAFNPFFSPDGEWLGFIHSTERTLYKVRLDGTERTLVGGDVPPASRSAVWNPDGTIVYSSTDLDGLWRIRDAGGQPERVPNTEGLVFYWMGGLPSGRAVLAGMLDDSADGSQPWQAVAVSLDSGERAVLAAGVWPRYIRSGHLLFWRDGSIWAAPFDADRLGVEGEAARVVSDVSGALSNGYAWFEVGGGTLLHGTALGSGGLDAAGTPVWLSRDGSEQVVDSSLSVQLSHPAVSPDGRRVAFAEPGARSFRGRIWIYDLDPGGGGLTLLTSEEAQHRHPFWSPDGRLVGFSSSRAGLYTGLYGQPYDQSAEARPLRTAQDGGLYEGAWTSAGTLFFRVGDYNTTLRYDLWSSFAHPDSAAASLIATGAAERNPAPSPDGTLLAYTSNESGRTQVYVRTLASAGGRTLVSQNGGTNPVWSRSGDELFYIDTETAQGVLTSAVIQREPEVRVASREVLFPWDGYLLDASHPQWDVAPDGQRFLAIRESADPEPQASFVIVENFDAELERLVPAN